MLKHNVDAVMAELQKDGSWYSPDGRYQIDLENDIASVFDAVTAREVEFTMQTLEEDFLPKLPNYVRTITLTQTEIETFLVVPDNVFECDYAEYAMRHKDKLFDGEGDDCILCKYDKVIAVRTV